MILDKENKYILIVDEAKRIQEALLPLGYEIKSFSQSSLSDFSIFLSQVNSFDKLGTEYKD